MSTPDYWLVYKMEWNRRDGAERVLLAYGWAADSTLAVWKSTDGGHHWRVVWESDIYTCYEEVLSLAISPDGRALMSTTNCSGGEPYLYWSVDAGETWMLAEPPAEAPTDRYGVMSVDYYQPTPEQ